MGAIVFVPKTEASSFGVLDAETQRSLLPVRAISEAFGQTVGWNASTQTVSIGGKYTMQIGKGHVYENGKLVHTLLATPKIINGSTYLPVRDMSTLFGTNIAWDSKNFEVKLNIKGLQYVYPVFAENSVRKPKVQTSIQSFHVNSKKLNAKVVKVNTLAPNTSLHVELANNKLHTVNSLASIAKAHKAVVAINGNYFDAYTSSKTVYNGLVMNGKMIKTFDRKFPVFYVTKSGALGILSGSEFLEKFDAGGKDPVTEALQVGPTLMRNGKAAINPAGEGFRDPKILTSAAMRSAVGYTKDRQLIVLTVPNARVGEVAEIMKQLGAYEAMNLDGGASSGLYVNGNYLTIPGRQIAVSLLVK